MTSKTKIKFSLETDEELVLTSTKYVTFHIFFSVKPSIFLMFLAYWLFISQYHQEEETMSSGNITQVSSTLLGVKETEDNLRNSTSVIDL